MTEADIQDLLTEEGVQGSDRRALEDLAQGLSDNLKVNVPYRPEFKAKLRRRLMAEAKKTLTPWYRKPAVWGTSMGVAAAAAVLVIGLRFYNEQNIFPGQAAPQTGTPIGNVVPAPIGRIVQTNKLEMPLVSLPDEPAPAGLLYDPAAPDLRQARVYRISYRPDERYASRTAEGLGFRGTPKPESGGFRIEEEQRRLLVKADGTVEYNHKELAASGAIPAEKAVQVAEQFLENAMVGRPEVAPEVQVQNGQATVSYTPTVDNRPIVNAKTIVVVDGKGAVHFAQTYARTVPVSVDIYELISAEEALTEAKGAGGAFETADLVYVRTPADQVVYLQPFWRTYGTSADGARVFRYISALKQ